MQCASRSRHVGASAVNRLVVWIALQVKTRRKRLGESMGRHAWVAWSCPATALQQPAPKQTIGAMGAEKALSSSG